MTTKYPLCLVAMELAAQLGERRLDLDLRWRRRDRNVEADALTNERFEGFDPELRVSAVGVWEQLVCLPALAAVGRGFKEHIAELRAERRARPQAREPRQHGRKRLRAREPW